MGLTTPITTIDSLHACLVVENLPASVEWYRHVLGFDVLQSQDFPEMGAHVVFLGSHGVELELVESENFIPARRPDPPIEHIRTQGISQLSFRVDDLETILERARSRNVQVALGLVDAKPLRLKAFFIRDNDGNLLEFVERY